MLGDRTRGLTVFADTRDLIHPDSRPLAERADVSALAVDPRGRRPAARPSATADPRGTRRPPRPRAAVLSQPALTPQRRTRPAAGRRRRCEAAGRAPRTQPD